MSPTKGAREHRFTKQEWSWILYDWANSVYATNIMAAIFPTIFVAFAGKNGDQWWGYATSIATFTAAVLAPILGSLADYQGMKKKLFTFFLLLGVVFTGLIAVTNDWRIMMIGYIFSRIGFSGSGLFYDSFLTDVTSNARMDKISSWGYAMGYIGGSTIPFAVSIALLVVLGYSSPFAQKFSILITSVWWLVFTIPFLRNVHQVHYLPREERITIRQAFQNIIKTARDIFQRRGLLIFTLAYFCYIDGVGTVISVSTAYGTTLGLGSVGMILALLVTQLVAVPCSIWFSWLANKITARKALMIAVLVYTVICLTGFYMGFSLEPHQEQFEQAMTEYEETILPDFASHPELSDLKPFADNCRNALTQKNVMEALDVLIDDTMEKQNLLSQTHLFYSENFEIYENYQHAIARSTIIFWVMATLVGTVQGGIQAVSRSYFGKLIPKERSNEYFGFFDIFGKFASVMGPFLYALISGWTGRASYGVLCLLLLFLIGFVLLASGKKEMNALEND